MELRRRYHLQTKTLQIISNTMFVVTDIKISATVLTTNALKIRFLTPMRSLIRPAISDNNIPNTKQFSINRSCFIPTNGIGSDVMIKHCIHTNKHS